MSVYAKQVFEDGKTLYASELNAMASGIADANINNYVHALPTSQSMANAIKRAHQLTDVLWTPKGTIPGKFYRDGSYQDYDFQEGVTYKGCPYEGGVISTYTYVGLNIDLDTFIGAVQNPNSILYNYNSNHQKGGGYYGTVCSKFAQYVLDVPSSYNTNSIPYIEGLETIAQPQNYTPYDVKLCDILVNTASHTVICTDLLYDTYGNLMYIEISEAVTPLCRRLLWTVDECYDKWIKTYRLCRYQHMDGIPYEKKDYVNVGNEHDEIKIFDCSLMPEYGDKCNYAQKSNAQGKVHILKKGYTKAIIKRDGSVIDTIAISDSTNYFNFSLASTGYLEMYLEDDSGNTSESVYGCVVKATITVTDSSQYDNGVLGVSYTGTSGTPIYVQFGQGQTEFCRLDGKGRSNIHDANSATLSFVPSRANKSVRVAYKNEYGTYYSSTVAFTVQEIGTGENTSTDAYLSHGVYYEDYALTMTDSKPSEQVGFRTFVKVPVEANTTYKAEGASIVWFFDKENSINAVSLSSDSNYEFTTPEATMYISITYDNTVESGDEVISRIEPTNAVTDIALSDIEVTFKDNTNLSSASYEFLENQEYFAYLEIPVEAGATYYTRGATRS